MWLEINICNTNTQRGMKGFKITEKRSEIKIQFNECKFIAVPVLMTVCVNNIFISALAAVQDE
jgi:hypothetical protein